MPYFSSIAVAAAMLASSTAIAQPAETVEHPAAPIAFLGVDLQGDFMTKVPECPPGTGFPIQPCRIATSQVDRFEVRGLPYLPISPGYKLFATVTAGVINQLVLTGNANNLYLVRELLTDQLGTPSDGGTKWVRLNSGASYEAEVLKWNAQGITVDFGRDLEDLGRYYVTFSPPIMGADAEQSDVVPAVDNLGGGPNG